MIPAGISSTWWVTITEVGACGSSANAVRVSTSRSPGRMLASPGSRFVEQQQFRVGHQGSGNLDSFAFALAQGTEGPLSQAVHPQQPHQGPGPGEVLVLVVFLPAANHPVGSGDHHVIDPFLIRDLLGQGRGGEPDPGPQVKDVDRAQDLTQDPCHTAGGVDLGGEDPQQGRLPGAVGSDHYPPVPLRQIDPVQQQ